jgi:hypothetical protein
MAEVTEILMKHGDEARPIAGGQSFARAFGSAM